MTSTTALVRLVTLLPLLFLGLVPLAAQEDRGGLVPDTRIALMDGTILVQDLTVGTDILTLDAQGKPVPGKVTGIRPEHADSYILVKAGSAALQATDSYRIAVPGRKLVRADSLADGTKVLILGARGVEDQTVTVREYPANLICYHLTIEAHRLFVAGGVVVGD